MRPAVAAVEPWDVDPWLDPYLIDCSCLKCGRGGRCRMMRELHAQCAARDIFYEHLASLTDDDLAWLLGHGWRPPDFRYPTIGVERA